MWLVVFTWEVDGAVVVGVNLVDHVLQLRLRWVLAQGSHDSSKLLGGDLSCAQAVSIDAAQCPPTCDKAV
jgi:hypothetical protein